MKRLVSTVLVGILLFSSLLSCHKNDFSDKTSEGTESTVAVQTGNANSRLDPPQTPSVKHLSWEKDQIFPTFPKGSGELDVIMASDLTLTEEKTVLSCLEGLVNAAETRFALYTDGVEEWAEIYGYKANKAKNVSERYDMIRKYASEVSGVILYSQQQAKVCEDIVNLATTIANVRQGLPMSERLYKRWKQMGIELPIIEDLTNLELESRYEVYNYLYKNVWDDCSQRILFIQNAEYHQMRDLASATGSAVIYLSCDSGSSKERRLLEKFLEDMTPGESILMGWNGQERELMSTAAKHGLSCVPADFFNAPSLFSQEMDVKVNPVPKMSEPENKIYIAFYFSDGDNLQYNMNAMKEYWDQSSAYRGQIPVNWTISPALSEVAPGMMNYYYGSATEKECFVCGPSGLGYTIPVSTFGEKTGVQFKNAEQFAAFVRMTNRYLMKSGLRTVTIWDNLTEEQREIYTSLADYLYGLTVQHFTIGDLDIGYTGVINGMLIQQMTPAYFAKNQEGTTKLTDLGEVDKAIRYLQYDHTAPIFISVQVSVWAFHNLKEVIDFEQYLSDKYAEIYGEDVVEFVRSDHYFNLYNQVHGLPYDLTLRSDLQITASSGAESAEKVADGTPDTLWEATDSGEQFVIFDFGACFEIDQMTLFFAESEGERFSAENNISDLNIEISLDGEEWKTISSADSD